MSDMTFDEREALRLDGVQRASDHLLIQAKSYPDPRERAIVEGCAEQLRVHAGWLTLDPDRPVTP